MPSIKLPAMSPTMEEGTLAKWLVKVGDTVKPGDVLAEIETDKAPMELEADDGGVVVSLDIAAGSEGVPVGTVIAVIRGEDEVAAPVPSPAPLPPSREGSGVGSSCRIARLLLRSFPPPTPPETGGEQRRSE